MADDSKRLWIEVGYDMFAKEGPKSLKVEVIARRVGISKSSFYHHFADLEIFTETLLNQHLKRAKIIAEAETHCKSVIPELLLLLVSVRDDLLFNRQLRVNRHVPAYRECFEKASREVGTAVLGIWAETLGLSDDSGLARAVLNLSLENFYLQITEETLTYEWLLTYINDLQTVVRALKGRADHDTGVVR